jgi:hypothetical protein
MSVYYQTFVVYGHQFDMDELDDAVVGDDELGLFDCSFHDEYSYDYNDDVGTGDIVMIADGRSSRYVYFGVLVAKSNSTRNGEQDIGRVSVDTDEFDEEIHEVSQILGEHRLEAASPAVHVFTHVT